MHALELADRSYLSFGTTPRLASMSAYAGDPPNSVTFASAAIRHSASGSG